MITIVVEILFYTLLFTLGRFTNLGVKNIDKLIISIPLIVFTISMVAEFIIWANKNNVKKKKVQLIMYLALMFTVIFFNVYVEAIVSTL